MKCEVTHRVYPVTQSVHVTDVRVIVTAMGAASVENTTNYHQTLRPPAGRQYGMPISQQPLNRSLPNFQQLLLMSNEDKVESFSSFAYG